MPIDKQETESRMQHFLAVCRRAGVKVTHQRMEIFRELAQTGEHPDAETVLRKVRQRVPAASLDTVYRTLWLLLDLDLVKTLGPLRERARFDANLKGHHHFVCLRCGLTRDFESKDLGNLPVPPSTKKFGRVVEIQIEARGVCRACGSKKILTGTSSKKRRGHD